jgi:hypothetical protein
MKREKKIRKEKVDKAMTRLYAYKNPEKKSVYIACIFSLINGVFMPLTALLIADIISDLSNYG